MKMFGAVLVVIGFGAGGLILANAYRERLAHLSQIIRGLNLLAVEVGYAMNPLETALRRVAQNVTGPVANFFAAAAQKVAALSNAGEAWKATLIDFQGKLTLTEQDWVYLTELSALLGVTDQANQIRAIREIVGRLEGVVHEAQEKMRVNEKILRYAGFVLGMILVLILY